MPTFGANFRTPPATTYASTDPGPPAIVVVSADTVWLVASPSNALENGGTNFTYTFLRWGNTQSALTANFSVGGGATFGTNYTQSGAATFTTTTGTVTFAAGSPVAKVTIDPTPDAAVEPNETVTLTVTADGYTAASPSADWGQALTSEHSRRSGARRRATRSICSSTTGAGWYRSR